MAVSQVEVFGLAHVIETSAGVAGTTGWKQDEPDQISKFSAIMKSVMRTPISPDRQDRPGSIVDLDASVEFTNDLVFENILDFIEAAMFVTAYTGQTTVWLFNPSAVTSSQFTVPSGGALLAGTLVYATGFTNAANNGLFVVQSSSTATAIKVTGTVAETPPATQNAQVTIAGFQGAADDLAITSGNLTSTVLDFTTIGLKVGQLIWIGGETTATKFVNAANRGYARVTAIAAHTVTLDKKTQAFTNETTTGSKTINVYWSTFLRNVPITDAAFLARTYTFEGTFHNLGAGPADEYGYATAQMCDMMEMQLPLASKGSVKYTFVGFDSAPPTTSRDTGASSPLVAVRKTLINTTSNIPRLRLMNTDESGKLTDFDDATLTIKQNVKPVKVLGTLGGKYVNYGRFSASLKAKLVMTDETVLTHVRNNDTVTCDWVLRSSVGEAIAFDMPSARVTGGTPQWTRNEVIRVDCQIDSFKDNTFGYSLGITLFAYVPAT